MSYREMPRARTNACERSFLEVAVAKLNALTTAAGFGDGERAGAVRLLGDLFVGWGDEPIRAAPRMQSDIGDDHFPIEFSLAFGGASGTPEVRVLFETRAPGASIHERWVAGLDLCARLERAHGASLDGLRCVADLFAPTDPSARYAMWHAVCLRPNCEPKFKLYVNPEARGAGRAPEVVVDALRRLGIAHPAPEAVRFRRAGDRYKFFSLDLASTLDARVKAYKVHRGATRGDIDAELAAAASYVPGLLELFWRTIAGDDGPFDGLPISTYLSWRADDDRRPGAGTAHFPIRAYVCNDLVARDRVRRMLVAPDLAVYDRAIGAFADRPLASGVGMHAYVSLSFDHGPPRVTVYLAPEGYDVAPPRPYVVPRPRIGTTNAKST